MTKVMRCRDLGPDCDAVVRAETEEELLKQVGEHAQSVHGMEVTAELVEAVRKVIKDA